MYYLYQFINYQNEIIYIGKSKNIKRRMKEHFGTHGHLPQECYQQVNKIYYAKVPSQTEMEMYETYFINKYHPIYNIEKNYNEIFQYKEKLMELTPLDWQELWLDFHQGIYASFVKPTYAFYRVSDSIVERQFAFLKFNQTQLRYRSGLFSQVCKNENALASLYQLLCDIEETFHLIDYDLDEPICFTHPMDNYIAVELSQASAYVTYFPLWESLGLVEVWKEETDDEDNGILKIGCFRQEGILGETIKKDVA